MGWSRRGEPPAWPQTQRGTQSAPATHSRPHQPGEAQQRFRGYVHVRLFTSIALISGTGKECDLMTVWEKVSIYSVWKGVACSESLSAPLWAHRRLHGYISPGGSPHCGWLPPDTAIASAQSPASCYCPCMKSRCQISAGQRCGHTLPSADSAKLWAPWGQQQRGHFCQHSMETS